MGVLLGADSRGYDRGKKKNMKKDSIPWHSMRFFLRVLCDPLTPVPDLLG
jgi:hypothetical protein